MPDSALVPAVAIKCSLIYSDDTWNCRGIFTPESVSSLADDIATWGLMEPIDVQPAADVTPRPPKKFKYRLVCGHRRLAALTTYLKRTTVPARIHRNMSEREARVRNLKENDERLNLNPLQEALALKEIIKTYPPGTSDTTIYNALKKTRRWFVGRLQLLEFPDEIQQMMAARLIAMHEIEVIRRAHTPEDQIRLARRVVAAKRGVGKRRASNDEDLQRRFRRTRGKDAINTMIGRILSEDLEQDLSSARVLAWAAGYVSDSEVNQDIDAILASKASPKS